MLRRTALTLLAGLLLSSPAMAPALADPPAPGGFNFYSEPARQLMRVQLNFGSNVITGALESALMRSRNEARVDSLPIPDDIRAGLAPFYPDETLDKVRYKVGDISPDGLAGFAIRNGNAAAVTLVDTIIFKDENLTKNLALWAHEVHHVEQFSQWGVNGFAARYAFGWDSVEQEARDRANEYVHWYRERMNLER
jgi:hypothetical protein